MSRQGRQVVVAGLTFTPSKLLMRIFLARSGFAAFVFLFLSLYLWAGQEYYEQLRALNTPGYWRALLFSVLLMAGSAAWDMAKHVFYLSPQALAEALRGASKALIFQLLYMVLVAIPFVTKVTPWREIALTLSPFFIIAGFASCVLAIEFAGRAVQATRENRL